MRRIARDLLAYYREFGHTGWYIFMALFLAACMAVNYGTDIRAEYLGRDWSLAAIGTYVLFYGFPYGVSLGSLALFTGETDWARRPGFWAASLFVLISFAIYANIFHLYDPWIEENVQFLLQWFVKKNAINIGRAIPGIALIFVFWLIWDRRTQPFYGFSAKRFKLWPYLLMLLIVLPFIVWASFQEDFLRMYPRYQPFVETRVLDWPRWLFYAVFEFSYGVDFVFTEMFFRGLMVMGLMRWLGGRVAVPMVALYCFIHFGKPLGEAIGSVVGGCILGVIAYQTMSIYGGIIVHLGVAYLMELTAILQTTWNGEN
jgi:hypothetical protein